MPQKFRSVGNGKSGGGGTRRLTIILIVVLVVAGLGVAGLFVFQNVFNQPANENTNVVTNTNTTNTNTNANANLNSNENANANDNTNVDTNTNTDSNTNASNTNTTTNTNTSTSTTPLPSSTDTDNDGLTDVEEVVYGTDSAKPDSDNDGFIDGKQEQTDGTFLGELFLGYNPAGPGRLEDSGIVKRVSNTDNSYSVLIPTSWTSLIGQAGDIQITPAQSTGEFFQIRINSNPTQQSPVEWFQAVSPNSDASALTTDAFNGFEVLYNPDRSTAYLFQGTNVYSIQYATGSLTQANYWTTFDMIVMNFRLVASGS